MEKSSTPCLRQKILRFVDTNNQIFNQISINNHRQRPNYDVYRSK